jgi:hypothetical protein
VPQAVVVPLAGKRQQPIRTTAGEDDAFLLDTAGVLPPGARATALLARCLPDGEAAARALTIGEREALLLHLRRLALGDQIDCVLRCPAASCGLTLDLPLRVGDLLLPPADESRGPERIVCATADARFTIAFRLPTAGDVDGAALLARADPAGAADAILERCVLRAERDGAEIAASELPAGVRAAIGAAMQAGDPQAEMLLEMRCPACGTAFSSLFDAASFVLQELEQRARRVLREVHTLALHYHWSEADILRMPAERRARYIELLQGAVTRGEAR